MAFAAARRDRSGRDRSNSEQQADNRACWPELVFVDPPYSDSISASKYAHKTRGDYEELVEDLRRDRFARRSPPVKNRRRTPNSMTRLGPSNTARSI